MKNKQYLLLCIFIFFACSIVGQTNSLSNNSTSKKDIPKYQKRNQYYNEIRGLNKKNAPKNYSAYRGKIYKSEKKKFDKINQSSSRSNSGEWSSDGPALFDNYSSIGRVNRIGFHPTNPDTIYAATAGGGLWYTPNHGLVWYSLSDHIPSTGLSGIVIDQYDPETLYVLTGDGDGCCGGAQIYDFGRFSTGVLKSSNHGDTWNQTGLVFDEEDEIRAYNLISDPINSQRIFACTNNGLYRTLTGWDSWANVLPGNIYEVAYKPDDNSIMYAIDRRNFYKSIDYGSTWSITATIPELNGEVSRMTMATCENDVDRVYLYAAPRHDSLNIHRGLFLSDTSGDSFTKIDSTSNLDGGRQGGYDLAVACSNIDSDDVLISKVRMYKSTNVGSSFNISNGLHADHHQLAMNPLLTNRVYAATDGGMYYSDDFGDSDSWIFMSEYKRITQYYKISVGQSNPQLVIGGAQDNGTHLNSDANAVFNRVFQNDGMDCSIHPTNDSLIILSSQDGDFEISYDMAASTSHLIDENDIPTSVNTAWVTPIAWDPINPLNIYLGYEPIYRSSNGGNTFNPIPDTIGGNSFLHVGTENTSRLYASDCYNSDTDCEYKIHRTDNNGTSWQQIHQNLPDSLLNVRKSGVTTNPNDSDEIWITLAGFDANNKVFRSIDTGLVWTNETGGLPNVPVNCIIYEDTGGTPSGAVYIGTDVGVYYKNDDLSDWIYFSNDLPAVEVSDLDIQYGSSTLYAGTYGRGIWTSELYSDCPNEYILNSNLILPERDYFFQAADSISLYDYTIESLGSHMKLKAGNVILISETFIAKSENQNLFKARLGPCSGGIESVADENEESGKN